MVKSKLPPRSGSVALRQLNPIHKNILVLCNGFNDQTMTFHKGLPTMCKGFLQMNQLFLLKSLQKCVKYTND